MMMFFKSLGSMISHLTEIYGAKFDCDDISGSFFRGDFGFKNLHIEHCGEIISIPELRVKRQHESYNINLTCARGECTFNVSNHIVTAHGLTIDIINTICPNNYGLNKIEFNIDYLRSNAPLDPNQYISLSELDSAIKTKIINFCDARFYHHRGIYTPFIESSIIFNKSLRKAAFGASTLTMQMMKYIFTKKEKTLQRKLIDMLLALLFEQACTKDELAEIYINSIEMAPGVRGILAGSQHYFGKHINDINETEFQCLTYFIPRAEYVPEALLMKTQQLKINLKKWLGTNKLFPTYIDFAEPYGRFLITR